MGVTDSGQAVPSSLWSEVQEKFGGYLRARREKQGMREMFYRHTLPVRIMHWINAGVLVIMFMSGLQIFNAHPALYWGKAADFDHPALSLTAMQDSKGNLKGITQIGDWQFDTTGILGASNVDGQPMARGFPDWITLPGPQWLAMGRAWHFFFAWILVINGLAFFAYAFVGKHFKRDLLPTREDIRHLGREIADHARLRFPKGEASKRYNALQKITYFTVIFILGPLIVLTGLTM